MSSVVERGRPTVPDPASGSIVLTPTEEWIARGGVPFIRHYTATTQIDVLSETEAKARSYYLFLTVHGLDQHSRRHKLQIRPPMQTSQFSQAMGRAALLA